MKLIKRIKYGLKRGVQMITEGVKEILSMIPCDKKLVGNVVRDILIGGAIAAVLIAKDYSKYADRIP